MSKNSLSAKQKKKIREAVYERDGFVCLLAEHDNGAGPCFGGLTPHHVVKASQGGQYTLENLVTLCAGHNDWCELFPAAARNRGLVRRPWLSQNERLGRMGNGTIPRHWTDQAQG